MEQYKQEHLEYICKQMNEYLNVPFYLLGSNGDILLEASTVGSIKNPLSPDKQSYLKKLINKDDPADFPIIRTTVLHENFLIVNLKNCDMFKGAIVGGPTLYRSYQEGELSRLINDMGPFIDHELISVYYNSLPIIKRTNLAQSGILLHYMVYQKILDNDHVNSQIIEREINSIPLENFDLGISNNLQNYSHHHDPIHENKLLEGIKTGNVGEVIKIFHSSSEVNDLGILSQKSQLRNVKNLSICLITLATRAAVEGGVHYEAALTLSDLYIQKLEEIHDLNDVSILCGKALVDFAERVQKSQHEIYSKPISLCRHYIFNHIYDRLTLSDLAELVELNPSYLSSQFKKETGEALSEYIQRMRIDEAKKLIMFSSYSLSDICSLLNFTDQSYFAKIFKKYTGTTPRNFLKYSKKLN